MKETILDILSASVEAVLFEAGSGSIELPTVALEVPKMDAHGDFSTNIAMQLASVLKRPPRKIAEEITARLQDPGALIEKTEIAGPGFINFFLRPSAWYPVLGNIHAEKMRYGASAMGNGERVQVEFVSSNPTGPLHVGHGRGAAVGDATANILRHAGYDVQKEYYINDSGRQIQTLGRSVYLRLLAQQGRSVDFPEDCYQGAYIQDLAREVLAAEGPGLPELPEDEAVMRCARYAAGRILEGIRNDLAVFGVVFDQWFSEQSLYDSGRVDAIIEAFRGKGKIYEKDGALWFRTSDHGDEKDRVVVRGNGQTTYFASDIAYHHEKYERGFDRVIDVWGADHHGYIPRVTAAIEAFGKRRDQFHVILVQLVNLLRGGEPVAMSTRAGEFVTLRDVIDEVGADAARFLFLTRHYESPLDFDLAVAKQQTNENPVFYVQYVHARISSIHRKAREQGIACDFDAGLLDRLVAPEEMALIKALSRYPETVAHSARFLEPHRVTFYLMDLASGFHAYYNKHRVLGDDPEVSRARLFLVLCVQSVIRNGLTLLGVSAPEQM